MTETHVPMKETKMRTYDAVQHVKNDGMKYTDKLSKRNITSHSEQKPIHDFKEIDPVKRAFYVRDYNQHDDRERYTSAATDDNTFRDFNEVRRIKDVEHEKDPVMSKVKGVRNWKPVEKDFGVVKGRDKIRGQFGLGKSEARAKRNDFLLSLQDSNVERNTSGGYREVKPGKSQEWKRMKKNEVDKQEVAIVHKSTHNKEVLYDYSVHKPKPYKATMTKNRYANNPYESMTSSMHFESQIDEYRDPFKMRTVG
jgi:hypothetical protein